MLSALVAIRRDKNPQKQPLMLWVYNIMTIEEKFTCTQDEQKFIIPVY